MKKKNGRFQYYYENGNLSSEGLYISSLKQGLWKEFDSLGHLSLESEYRDGKLDGIQKGYYPSGKLRRKEIYKVGGFLRGQCFDTIGEEIDYYPIRVMPEFKGGETGLIDYLSKHIAYPKIARKNGTQGTVDISFVITELGKVTEAKVAKSISKELDDEALRVIESMPKWKPGMYEGTPVKTYFTIPISFSLSD